MIKCMMLCLLLDPQHSDHMVTISNNKLLFIVKLYYMITAMERLAVDILS